MTTIDTFLRAPKMKELSLLKGLVMLDLMFGVVY